MKKLPSTFLSIACLVALCACENGTSSSDVSETSSASTSLPPQSKISLYSDYSRLVYLSMDDKGSAPLSCYHHADHPDVPYVELGQFIDALSAVGLFAKGRVERLCENLYAFSQQGVIIATFNPEIDQVTVYSFDNLLCSGNVSNNDVGWDTCSPRDTPDKCVHTSYETTIEGEITPEEYDFGAYDFDMVGNEGELYLPVQPLSNILTRMSTFDVAYNGHDFFLTVLLNEQLAPLMPGTYSSFYASKDQFAFSSRLFKACDPVGEETHRFYADTPSGVTVFAFLKDHTVELRTASSKEEEGAASPQNPMLFTYEENDLGIYVTSSVPSMGIAETTFLIPNDETYFNAQVRPAGVAKHSYDLLRFQYENIYGLQEELHARYGVKNVEELVAKKNLKDRLLSTDASAYDDALCEFLLGSIDDGHTKYPGRCLFSGMPKTDIEDLVAEKTGQRRSHLFDLKTEYQSLRQKMLSPEDPEANLEGLSFEGKTAIIRFDTFAATSEITNLCDGRTLPTEDPNLAIRTSTPDGIYLAMKEVEKRSEIENVVLDLTCNGGGAAVTLPYVAALFTDDPTFILRDTSTDVIKEYHYQVDLNRNGVFNEPEDTYKGRYEFFVLTSGFSFSCGNAIPTMAHIAGVKVIGEQSGGGACPVASVSDGSGTIYNTSMPVQISYEDASGNYINNDAGIPVPEELSLPKESWYDLAALDAFVCGL